MFGFFANIFGYLLKFLYDLVNNYGLAIILFTVTIKLLLLPLSYKQLKTTKKTAKLQEKIKAIQFKYKNDQEKMNQEMMKMYKEENMSPFSGCATTIIQMLLLLSIFYLVRCPLTYMEKISPDDINKYVSQIKDDGQDIGNAYPEIAVIRNYKFLKEKNDEDEIVNKVDLQMNFLGLDLSKIPQQNLNDYTVYIIPVLYIISTFISMKLTTLNQNKKQNDVVIDGNTGKEENNEVDTMEQTNKMMSWMMPIMSVSIALVAPLGLALYWLINNVLMIIERLVLNKVIKD